MANTTVFVDRAVTGDLPSVCVRTGLPATRWGVEHHPIGGMGAAAWLLVFLGPIGWLALMILMGGGRGTGREILSIQLPYSDEAWTRHAKRKRWRTYAGILCVTALVAGLFSVGGLLYSGWFVLAGIFFLAALVAHLLLTFDEVDITLDATRRWLTLHNVHESFVAALNTTPSRTPEL